MAIKIYIVRHESDLEIFSSANRAIAYCQEVYPDATFQGIYIREIDYKSLCKNTKLRQGEPLYFDMSGKKISIEQKILRDTFEYSVKPPTPQKKFDKIKEVIPPDIDRSKNPNSLLSTLGY